MIDWWQQKFKNESRPRCHHCYLVKDWNSHLSCSLTAFLASTISRKCDLPSEICAFLGCIRHLHARKERVFGVLARSAQISSVACSLSSMLICSNSFHTHLDYTKISILIWTIPPIIWIAGEPDFICRRQQAERNVNREKIHHQYIEQKSMIWFCIWKKTGYKFIVHSVLLAGKFLSSFF